MKLKYYFFRCKKSGFSLNEDMGKIWNKSGIRLCKKRKISATEKSKQRQ